MRIAMIGPFGFHPNKTMRSRALGLARPLAGRGHQIALFMPPWQTPEEADKRWQEDGVTIRYIPLHGGVPGIMQRLVREALAWQPDVVHCFKPKAYSGLAGWWLWRFHRHRLRLIMDSDDWEGWGGWNELAPYPAWQKRLFAWQEQWGMRHCHTLTVASRTLQSLAWAQGVPPERVAYIPNGPGIRGLDAADRERIRGEKREALGLGARPTVLLYSRLFEFDTMRLVEILKRVQAAFPDLAVLAVGAGLFAADAEQFRRQLAAAGLLDAVVDVGWVDPEALPALLAAADAGVYLMDDTLLNRTKCPVKLADMLYVGVPVVAETVGQVPEYVVHGRTGRLCASGDVVGMAAALIHLLQDVEDRKRLAEEAVAYIAHRFQWDRLAERLLTVYST
ncbi:MAG: glycosyltransferase [Anaerolineae bacterium]